MIHAEISVDPHYHEVNYTNIKKFEFDPKTPPHVIFKKSFKTWAEAKELLVNTLELKTTDKSLEVLVDDVGPTEYVEVELELLDVTGTIYTKAILAIEGDQEQENKWPRQLLRQRRTKA